MSDTVIHIQDLGKCYRLGGQMRLDQTLPEAIAQNCRRLAGRLIGNGPDPTPNDNRNFWALRHVDMEVQQGQVVGIVGRNGAGKTTLLKILSQITDPTEGQVRLRGRVASLLEVGTGFHPELTGRENVYLNGSILGMRKREIDAKFDQIVDFSGVERFLDTPVKRYSSGMTVRLAFAVAAHLEPELLLVDEVLAVGDSGFQKKCLAKMNEVAGHGRTVLFVSHNMRAVRSLCTSAVYLKDGQVAVTGSVDDVLNAYSSDFETEQFELPLDAGDIVVHGFDVGQRGRRTCFLDGADPIDIDVDFQVTRPLDQFRLGVYVRTGIGDTLLRSFTGDWDNARNSISAGRYRATLTLPEKYFLGGNYTILLHASRYGVTDYLAEHNISHRVTITTPADFNPGHMSEQVDSLVLLNRPWQIRSTEAAA